MTSSGGVDIQVFNAINEFARDTGWLHAPLLDYANYGVVVFAVLLLAGWWVARGSGPRTVAAAIWAVLATLIAVGLNQPISRAVHEARPFRVEPHILVLAHRSTDFSFPSDHAVMAGAVAAGLWLVSTRLGIVASVLAVVMAFARVYVGVHFPQDVIAGLVLGAAVALVGWLLVGRILTWLFERLATTPLRPLVSAQPKAVG
jgi:membrane-associated phospholipid phosphatase